MNDAATRRRLLLFLQRHADRRGRVRMTTKQIARRLSRPGRLVSEHDVVKLLWHLRRAGEPVDFREDKVSQHSKSGVLRDIRVTK